MSNDAPINYGLGTLALHAAQVPDPATGSRAVPIHQTTSYVFRNAEHAANLFALKEMGFIYTRLMNPTTDVFEQRLAALDGGVGAMATSSGQQAITVSLLNLCHSGGHLVSAAALYGGTVTLLAQTFKRLGIEVTFVDMTKPSNISAAIRPNTRAVFMETLANPKNDVLDYEAIAKEAHKHGVPVICDNTVMTPLLFRPFDYGIDINVYSTTKFIGGHGTSIGGAIVDSGKFEWGKQPERWPQFTKPDPSYHGGIPRSGWQPLLHSDLPHSLAPRYGGSHESFQRVPLPARSRNHSLADAETLRERPGCCRVSFQARTRDVGELPGLKSHPNHDLAKKYLPKGAGAILGFGIKGGREAGARFIDSVKLASHLANIGDAKTLVIHPATTTHSQLTGKDLAATGVTEDYVRVSVGLEDVKDIIADLDQALRAAQG